MPDASVKKRSSGFVMSVSISSGGAPTFLIAEEQVFEF